MHMRHPQLDATGGVRALVLQLDANRQPMLRTQRRVLQRTLRFAHRAIQIALLMQQSGQRIARTRMRCVVFDRCRERAMRFVDNSGAATEAYPFNPNGSPDGLTAVTTPDGRFTVLMPHAERVFRNVQMSWTSGDRSSTSPWTRMFANARVWIG